LSLLRILTILIISVCLVFACKTTGTKSIPIEDSAEYYPSTPQKIDKADFRKIYRMASEFYDSTLERTGFNGGILIAKGGEVIFEKYAGTVHLGKPDSINASTSFHIASTTKTFTAMAVLKLAEAGKLSLNDSIQQFFPAFPYHGMTIKMLLSQRSGLPNYGYFLEKLKWDERKKVSNADILNTLIQYKPDLTNMMNKRFNYSNTNFVILALIIEKVSGMSYAEYLKQTFFIPLKMTHTYVFNWNDSATATPSYMWNGRQEVFNFLDITYGDKNIYSSVTDLLKWDQALYDTKFFKQSTLDSAFQPYSFEKPGIHNYGLGWRMYTLPSNKKILYHNGWWHGSNATFYRAISDSVTIIIIGNKFNRNIYRVKPLIEAMTDLRFAYIDEE
jgi:CubicO group peptidase (beta-lactamase class C family)